jgi:Secretion system C-terminal sorting domain/Photosynthesis system II assembly factor YCF48
MKNSIYILIFTFFLAINSIFAQVWQAQDLAFPVPSQGYTITPVNDSVAWTFGFAINPDFSYTNTNFVYFRTINGGQTWEQGSFPHTEPGYFSNLSSLNKDVAWISYVSFVDGNHLLKTEDGGQTWEEHSIGIDTWINFAYFFSGALGVAMGDPGNDNKFQIYTTTNSGTYWTKVNVTNIPNALPGETGISDDFAVNGNNITFQTTKGRFFHSENKGFTWDVWAKPTGAGSLTLSPEIDDAGYNYLYVLDPIPGMPSCQIYRRTITDTDWTDLTPVENNRSISYISAVPGTSTLIATFREFWDVTESWETRVSYDHGDTWMTIADGDDTRPQRVDFLNAEIGYASQAPLSFDNPTTTVYKYIGSPLVGLLNLKPLDVNLSISPNPTSDFINITLKSPKNNDFWLLLNDASGRLIAKKEFEKVEEIAHSFAVNGLAAGIYTVTVSSAEGLVSRQVVVQ